MPRPLSLSEKQKILKLAHQRLPSALIAEVVERSPNAVYDTLKEYGVPVRQRQRYSPEGMQALTVALALIAPAIGYLEQTGADAPEPDALELDALGMAVEEIASAPPGERRVCATCGVEWTLTEEHAEWFSVRQMESPRRCESCRRHRKHSGSFRRSSASVEALRSLREALTEALEQLDDTLRELDVQEPPSSVSRWGPDLSYKDTWEGDFERD